MTTDANASRQDQARLVAALAQPARFDAECERVTVLETHISYVLLTGRFAYKLKKAVDFGFLDFTTLAARRHFCEEELRLNRRLAPALYLDVVPIGAPNGVLQRAQDNCSTLLPLLDDPVERWEVEALAAWTAREHAARRAAFARRLEEGFVRECHGDLHLGNIARIDGELTIFDCIEFNPALRWIDVMSEVAFTVMDLEDRGRADLSHRFLNAYLERTGEYAGLAVLRFYLVYRALVRAKIARLRTAQLAPGEERSASVAEYHGYVHLVRGYAGSPQSAIVITHGLSGSGKTQLSEALLEALGAVRVRSDVERKRLHGLDPRDRRGAEHGLYAGAATDATYRRLAALTREIVVAGYVAVVDAAFLKRAQRDLLRDLAAKLGVAFVILALPASEATLRERVGRRSAAGSDVSDADLAVLGYQLHTQEPLAPDEEPFVVWYDAEAPLANARAPEAWHAVRERIAHTVWDRRRSP